MRRAYEMEGFSFATVAEADLAKREAEGVKYIRQKVDFENPEMVYQVYENLIEQNLFETPVGYCFLHELREYLVVSPAIRDEDVSLIPVQVAKQDAVHMSSQREKKTQDEPDKRVRREKNVNYKSRCYFFMVATLVLTISIGTMMLIAASSDHPNILNYENELINKYAAWEADLEEREQALKEAQ